MCFQKNYEKKDRRQAGKENGGDTIYYIYIIYNSRFAIVNYYLLSINYYLLWRFRAQSGEG